MDKIEKAKLYYASNFNCSQAVFTTFVTEMGIEEELALKLGTMFGGGARKGELCGAVAGALMVLGLKYGHSHGTDFEEKGRAFKIGEEYMNRFVAENGSTVCRDILGYDLTKPEDRAKIMEQNLFRTKCSEMVESAAKILEQMIMELQ